MPWPSSTVSDDVGPFYNDGSSQRRMPLPHERVSPPAGKWKSDGGGDRWCSSAPPLTLLFLALATVFLFGGGRGHFYQKNSHADIKQHHMITQNHMTVAMNLSPEHDFLGFYHPILDGDGDLTYYPYNRFPVLGHVLIKLATLPFPDDLSARLAAARMLMLAFFAAAATLAYLALCGLVRSRWAALAATLLSFSSYYTLYYNDMVATEGVVGLFGVMLVFHGMAVYATEGRFGQLLAKTCAALLLDWHVYALLLPYVLLGLAAALRHRDGRAVRRHLTLGVVALVLGSLVLAGNFTREYVALGGEVAAAELPSVRAMLHRTGVAPKFGLDSTAQAKEQLGRIGAATVPWTVGYFISDINPDALRRSARGVRMYVVLGSVLSILIVLTTLVLFLSPATRHRLPLAALALSGPCWAVAMRYNVHHGFEAMFYIGIPLAGFVLMLPRLDRLLGGRVRCSVLAGLAAVPMFVLSSFLMARAADPDPEHATYMRALAADVDSIRELAEGKTIFVSAVMEACSKRRDRRANWMYYFTGNVFVSFADRRLADFVVSGRIEGARPLTPGNRWVFLYDRAGYDAALSRYEQHAQHGAPVLDSPDYDVYLVERSTGNELLYFDDHCPANQVLASRVSTRHRMTRGKERLNVFLHAWPSDANDLPARRRRFGFDPLLNGTSVLPGWRKDGKCYAVCRLPDYGIARIHTGWTMERSTSKDRRYDVIWEGSFSPGRATGGDLRSLRPAPSATAPVGSARAVAGVAGRGRFVAAGFPVGLKGGRPNPVSSAGVRHHAGLWDPDAGDDSESLAERWVVR